MISSSSENGFDMGSIGDEDEIIENNRYNDFKSESPLSNLDEFPLSFKPDEFEVEDVPKPENNDLIAEIFGESEEEYEVSVEEEPSKKARKSTQTKVTKNTSEVPDYLTLIEKNKRFKTNNRKKKYDIIDNRENYASKIVSEMIKAAQLDRNLVEEKKCAMNKLNLLPKIITNLINEDFIESLIDQGLYRAIASWLEMLPDGTLPNIEVRRKMIYLLQFLPKPSTEELKNSGLGKAIMVLFKHPDETRDHKNLAHKYITDWVRPIYGLEKNPQFSKDYVNKVEYDSTLQKYQKSMPNFSLSQVSRIDTEDFNLRAVRPDVSSKIYVNRPVNVLRKNNKNEQDIVSRMSVLNKNFSKKIQRRPM